MTTQLTVKELRKKFVRALQNLEGGDGQGQLKDEVDLLHHKIKRGLAMSQVNAAKGKLAFLVQRQWDLHRGGSCPCVPECPSFAQRRRHGTTSYEDCPDGMDVLECCTRLLGVVHPLDESREFRVDAQGCLKEEIAKANTDMAKLLAALQPCGKAATTEEEEEEEWLEDDIVPLADLKWSGNGGGGGGGGDGKTTHPRAGGALGGTPQAQKRPKA